ncbi:Arc family DNA binding domain-containing protein [Photorhabdus luminescens]|uniref:Arc-like DNA binding domain protein n=2 Tax=Photorhabdus TaxID=29487 RepID=A0A1C0U6Q4_9GAMM|nr:Arc-like DNA binding domain protein [Photorhabdus australis subsp. thailandensis]QXF34265.1 Arc family DNA binding domain-containing protein [Photorhabdus akhurstii]UJD76088.1 Arc family DNA binding domain-containing protein [Photorhabdus luminescens]
MHATIIMYLFVSEEGMKKEAQAKAYPLRLPQDVRDWYQGQAKLSGRSFNSEVAKVLTERMNRSIGRVKNT